MVDQAAHDGFPVDRPAVKVGDGEVAAVVFTAGTRWAMPWCGRAVL